MKAPLIFIRDDDVWAPDEVFQELFGFLMKRDIPVIYGVIPSRLEAAMAKVLKDGKECRPAAFDIVQHGFSHTNYASGGKPKYEFGKLRSYSEQYHDVAQGRKIMRARFGDLLTPGFIPPYHGYNVDTIKVMQDLKVPIFSSGRKVLGCKKTFIDLPATVLLNKYSADSKPLAFDLRCMIQKASEGIRPGKITGMLYHHNAVKTGADMKAIKAFLELMAEWRDKGRVRLVLFSDILRVKRKFMKILYK